MIDYKAIGRRISLYRKKKGLTQSIFSETLGISESYVSQVERGIAKVSLTRLDQIANVLDTDIACFISDNPVKTDTAINSEIYEITKDWSKENIDFLIGLLLCADEQFQNREKE